MTAEWIIVPLYYPMRTKILHYFKKISTYGEWKNIGNLSYNETSNKSIKSIIADMNACLTSGTIHTQHTDMTVPLTGKERVTLMTMNRRTLITRMRTPLLTGICILKLFIWTLNNNIDGSINKPAEIKMYVLNIELWWQNWQHWWESNTQEK